MPDCTFSNKITLPNTSFLTEIVRLLNEGRTVTFLAKGNSMRPFIRGDKDSVVLKRTTSISKGDIVLAFIDENRYVLHRVIRVHNDDCIELMGDGNYKCTEQCSLSNIVGTAVQIIRNGKRIECNSPAEQKKAMLWIKLLPIRRYLLFVLRIFSL